MPTLVIDNMPQSLFERINGLARVRNQEPAQTAVDVLENALHVIVTTLEDVRLPNEPFLTEEICPSVSIPRPEGNPIIPLEVADYVPKAHDLPNGE